MDNSRTSGAHGPMGSIVAENRKSLMLFSGRGFPELADETTAEDNAPSCSVAEALERQSLFINRVVASHALSLLFDLLARGSIGHAGAFLNLSSGHAAPIPLPRSLPMAA